MNTWLLHPPKGPTEERGNLCTPRHCHSSHSSISRQDTGWEKWADPVYLTRGNDSTRSQLGRYLETPGHLRALKLHPGPGYRLKPLNKKVQKIPAFSKKSHCCTDITGNFTLSFGNSFACIETASAGHRAGPLKAATVLVPSQLSISISAQFWPFWEGIKE